MLRTLATFCSALCMALLVSGCGTPYATVPDRDGHPVMLLGHDPVAYFTRGEPMRGQRERAVTCPIAPTGSRATNTGACSRPTRCATSRSMAASVRAARPSR